MAAEPEDLAARIVHVLMMDSFTAAYRYDRDPDIQWIMDRREEIWLAGNATRISASAALDRARVEWVRKVLAEGVGEGRWVDLLRSVLPIAESGCACAHPDVRDERYAVVRAAYAAINARLNSEGGTIDQNGSASAHGEGGGAERGRRGRITVRRPG